MPVKLLLFHPGAFSGGNVGFEDDAAAYGASRGFVVNELDYPTCDPPAAMTYAINSAAAAAQDGSDVYAYGDSAGAMLAIRLAEKGRVRAAAGFSPVVDWSSFVRDHPNASSVDCMRSLTDWQLDRVSINEEPCEVPVVVIGAQQDLIASYEAIVNWAGPDPLAWCWTVQGSHLCGGPPNADYETQMKRAINWMATLAGL